MPSPGHEVERAVLSAELSHVLVAFTIELDNEFEHRMPHRTTRHGSTPGHARAPWLVSFPMWVHCMRHVPEDGIPARELVLRSGLTADTMQHVVKRLAAWWGYLQVGEPATGSRGAAAAASRRVRPSVAGRQAQAVWRPLEGEIEARWRDRFGTGAVERLRAALQAIVWQLDTDMPDYLPVGQPQLRPRPTDGPAQSSGAGSVAGLGLPGLISKVLLALALDFEQRSDLELPVPALAGISRLAITANLLRAFEQRTVRVSELPARTGVAKMAVDTAIGHLDKRGYVRIGPDPAGSRFKVATLTTKGGHARERYWRWAEEVEERFGDRFGAKACGELHEALWPICGDPGIDSLLRRGMEPYPDGWRAQVPKPRVLPDYPVVSLGGGFPDGS